MKPATTASSRAKNTTGQPSKIYKWKNDWHNPKSDVSLIGPEIERLATSHPNNLHEEMVKVARNKQNPMHWEFTWDDTAAARTHRLTEARHLHNNVVFLPIVVQHDSPATLTETLPRPIIVSIRDRRTSKSTHRLLENVLSNPEERAQLLAQALRDLEGFQNRYNQLSELSVVFDAIRKVTSRSS